MQRHHVGGRGGGGGGRRKEKARHISRNVANLVQKSTANQSQVELSLSISTMTCLSLSTFVSYISYVVPDLRLS